LAFILSGYLPSCWL